MVEKWSINECQPIIFDEICIFVSIFNYINNYINNYSNFSFAARNLDFGRLRYWTLEANEMNDAELPKITEYRIALLPLGVYYITQFLTPEEERSLLDKVCPSLSMLLT